MLKLTSWRFRVLTSLYVDCSSSVRNVHLTSQRQQSTGYLVTTNFRPALVASLHFWRRI